MASLNKIILIGNVGNDPEMRFTADGKPVTGFSLATNQSYINKDGERVDKTTWFKITCWNKLAENVNQFMTKGKQVYIEGRVELNEWEAQDGTPRSSLAVTANTVLFLGKREEGAGDESTEAVAAAPELDPDDLPF